MFTPNGKIIVITLTFLLIASFFASSVHPLEGVLEEPVDHANLTGDISDVGVDVDGSGKFDYLKISVEVNVSVAGEYIVNLYGLMTDEYFQIHVSDTRREYLTSGIHMVDVYLYGPVIYQSSRNPVQVFSISLKTMSLPSNILPQTIDDICDVPLSRQYNYTEFDASFSDVDAVFTVYPDGSVALSGALNLTHMIPFNPGPNVQCTASMTRNGDVTTTLADCTFAVPSDVPSRVPVELPVNTTEISYQELYSDGQSSSKLSVNMTLPLWLVSEYPFNTTDFYMLETYSEGIGNMEMNCTTVVPESIRSMFPFNVTDVTVTGQYLNGQLTGTITFSVISGFPLFSLNMDFEGNTTDISLTGQGLVIYGDFPMIGFEINQTILEGLLAQYNSTIPGQGTGSLYEMTNGILECTHLDTTLTPYNSIGAYVDFDVGIQGDLIELVAYMAMQYLPPDTPPETGEQLHDILYSVFNTTVNSVESIEFQIAYMKDNGEAEIRMTFEDDILYLVNSLAEIAENATALDPSVIGTLYWIIYPVIPINASLPYISEAQTELNYSSSTGELQLTATSYGEVDPEEYYYPTFPLPEELPPELRELFESLQEAMFWNMTSYEQSFTYKNSVGNFKMESTLEGDIEASANLMKNFIVTYMSLTSPQQITWRELFLNQTVVNLVELQMNFNVSSTWATGNVAGIVLSPPIDPVNGTCFKLKRFFNLTSLDYGGEPPMAGQCLRIMVQAGSNMSHDVILHRPGTVPIPDEISPEMTWMMWHNQSISGINDLMFTVVQVGHETTVTWEGKPYKVATRTNSTITEATFDQPSKKISFDVEGAAGTVGFCNVSIPKTLLYASPTEWTVLVDGVPVTPTITESATHVFMFFEYSHSKKTVEIIGTHAIPEFPSALTLLLLMMLTLVAAALARGRSRNQQPLRQKSHPK